MYEIDDLYALETRAGRVHPDEPAGTARELLNLIAMVRESNGKLVGAAARNARVRVLADEWIASPDIQVAAAGRLVHRALDGAAAPRDLI